MPTPAPPQNTPAPTLPGQGLPGSRQAHRRGRGGFTVLEASIAGAIVMAFLTSLFALNANMMRMLGSASETANASQNLQTRVEQVRLADWPQISDPAWVAANLLGTRTDAAVNLPGLTETITVSAYAAPSTSKAAANPGPFTVTRKPDGTVSISPGGYSSTALGSQEMLQVTLAVSWPGWTRDRNRALTTLVSRWGVSK